MTNYISLGMQAGKNCLSVHVSYSRALYKLYVPKIVASYPMPSYMLSIPVRATPSHPNPKCWKTNLGINNQPAQICLCKSFNPTHLNSMVENILTESPALFRGLCQKNCRKHSPYDRGALMLLLPLVPRTTMRNPSRPRLQRKSPLCCKSR